MRNLLRGLKRVGLFFVISFILFGLLHINHTKAAINPQINFQGKLTNTDGTNVTNGTYSIIFSIYTVASGGSNIWSETQSSVSVTDGIFRVALGSVTSLPGSVDFNTNSIYLGIKVGADLEMTPRVQFTAAPYAFNSDKLGGVSSSGYVQLAQGIQIDSSASNASIAINKTGATASLLQLQRAGSDVMTIANDGSYAYTLSATNNPTYNINNNGTANVVTNLAGTGNYVIQDNGTAFATFGGNGSITLAPTGTSDVIINEGSGVNTQITATAVPIVDQLSISNAGQPVTAAGINGLSVNYVGGAAAVEAAGMRIDYAPGGTSGGTWSGLRIVANTTGPAAGVSSYGIKIEGPTTPGSGTEIGINVTTGFDIGMALSSGGLELATQSDPATPAANNLRLYAKVISGKVMLKAKGPSGLDYPLQPSFFQNNIQMINVSRTNTAVNVFGTTATSTGTLSTPVVTEAIGYMKNFATTGAGTVAGTYQTDTTIMRGALSNGASGWFFNARVAFPDASYANTGGATGSRTFIGLTSGTFATAVATDNPAGHRAGFSYVSGNTGRIDTNWQFSLKDGVTENLIDTGVAFSATKVYDLYTFTPPGGTTVYWRIDNVSDGITNEGSTTTNMPGTATLMRFGIHLLTINNVTRNIMMQRLYLEQDR